MSRLLLCIVIICCTYHQGLCTEYDEMLPRIGIIGAGISGTSSALYLRQLFGKDATIDVFEANKVGGRTALVNINGQEYEAGGSVIHDKNKYMVDFANKFLDKSTGRLSRGAGMIGLYGQDGMVLQTSNWMAVTLAKLVWRYGMDLYNVQEWTKNLLNNKFNRIYDFQEKGMSFTTVDDMLRAMHEDLLNMTRYSMKDVMRDAGLSQRFIDEFGMAAMRNNYGQTTDVHGLVGAVSMIGVEPGLWSVHNGNVQIPLSLLKESAATLIKGKVNTVTLVKDDFGTGSVSYEVDYEKEGGSGEDKMGSREYDIVIVATPVESVKNKISFVDFPNPVTSFSQNYHTTVALFVEGAVNKSTFHLSSPDDFPPDLFTVSPELFFNSMGKQSPVAPEKSPDKPFETGHAVWKAFFNEAPTEEQISRLFEARKNVQSVTWQAYPEYKANMDLPPFMLYDRLYYVNAIESAAAALEMNVIGSRNVALLAYNQWHGHFDKIDEIHLPEQQEGGADKSEL